MRIIVAHNQYSLTPFGGERRVVENEIALLRSRGNDVYYYERSNDELAKSSFVQKAFAPFRFGFSRETYRQTKKLIASFRPDLLHVHNYKYVITPSIFRAAQDCGVPTVLTLHNYRLSCPAALFLCRSQICRRCEDGNPLRMLWSPCNPYENSLRQRFLQLCFYWETQKTIVRSDCVDAFVVLSEFARACLIRQGVEPRRVFVKPNFCEPLDVSRRSWANKSETNAIEKPLEPIEKSFGTTEKPLEPIEKSFGTTEKPLEPIKKPFGAVAIGRLSVEKGFVFLLDAWKEIDYPLTIIGDGPQRDELERIAPPNVVFRGEVSHEKATSELSNAAFFVFPSICYEGFPTSLLEAFSAGVPAVASDLGARGDMIVSGENGFLFESQNVEEFRRLVRLLISDDSLCERLGRNARSTYEKFYSPQKNYDALINVYQSILDARAADSPKRSTNSNRRHY